MKIWNSDVMNAGKVIQIRDFERDAVLTGEAGSQKWREKMLVEAGSGIIATLSNQLVHSRDLRQSLGA